MCRSLRWQLTVIVVVAKPNTVNIIGHISDAMNQRGATMAISFADRGGTKGYQVRVTRNGKQYTKFFNASERGAKKRAQEYEQELLEMLGPPSKGSGTKRPVRTNTGIRYITETTGKYGTACFRVTFRQENGHWASRDVSIDQHGRTEALKIAKQIHRENHIPAEKDKKSTPSPRTVRRRLSAES